MKKLYKFLIFLVFLAVFALASVFTLRSFMPELFDDIKEKYGLGAIGQMK